MTSRNALSLTALALIAVLAVPVGRAAQAQDTGQLQHYAVIDMGTFGGSQSYLNFYAQVLNRQGVMAGFADTSAADPHFPTFSSCANPDCLYSHAFQSHNGVVTDLGTLPGGADSNVNWISDSGLVVGGSQNGVTDPLIGSPEYRAVLWQNGQIRDLGTLGGNESFAGAVNNAGQVVGVSSNTIPDPFSLFGWGTQTRGFVWANGVITDVGTLGGPDTAAGPINERGQVTGQSYTNSTPNATTGLPTADPFLWQNGTMTDLGTLGGTFGYANAINNRGQVAGDSNLAGDTATHPFLWDGAKMIDLGSLGGTSGDATAMNDAGAVVGSMNLLGNQLHEAFLWKDGVLRDLGTLDKCSTAWGINDRGQIVGASGDCGIGGHAFLWENGQMIDLTKLVPPGIALTYGLSINDSGEIACLGRVPGGGNTGLQHAFLLIPGGATAGEGTPSAPQESGGYNGRSHAPGHGRHGHD